MSFFRPLLSILFTLLIFSCQEPFTPEQSPREPVLVVDAMITDQPGPYRITLRKSNPFQDQSSVIVVSGAEVYLTDQRENRIDFQEHPETKGYYYSPDWFQGAAGDTYVLHVNTPDKNQYESAPQTILPSYPVERFYGTKTIRQEVLENQGGKYVHQTPGASLFIDILTNEADIFQQYRIDHVGYVQYMRTIMTEMGTVELYCWKKNYTHTIYLTGAEFNVGSSELKGQDAGFLPLSKKSYYLEREDRVDDYAAILTLYRLNQDTYQYYKKMKEILEAEGKLFDPVPSQLEGNIRCLNAPDQLVLGFFEASSKLTFELALDSPPEEDKVSLMMVSGLQFLQGSSHCSDEKPSQWIE